MRNLETFFQCSWRLFEMLTTKQMLLSTVVKQQCGHLPVHKAPTDRQSWRSSPSQLLSEQEILTPVHVDCQSHMCKAAADGKLLRLKTIRHNKTLNKRYLIN